MFEFIERMNEVVRGNSQTHIMYLRFLIKEFTEYDLQETHSEAFIRRTFSILNTIIIQGRVENGILLEVLPGLF